MASNGKEMSCDAPESEPGSCMQPFQGPDESRAVRGLKQALCQVQDTAMTAAPPNVNRLCDSVQLLNGFGNAVAGSENLSPRTFC